MLSLNRRLSALEAAAESADMAPTAADQQVLQDSLALLDTQMQRWRATVARIERLNGALHHAGIAPIHVPPLRLP